MSARSVEKLKQLTLDKSAVFSDCMHYFLDLTEDPQFLAEGEELPHRPDFFELLLQPVAMFFKAKIERDSFLLIQIKKHRLIHGSVRLSDGRLVMLYYFEDIASGIAGTGTLGRKENHFFRLTLKLSGVQASSPVLH